MKRNKLRMDAMRLREVKFDEKIKNEHSLELNKEQDKLWKKYEFYDKMLKAYKKGDK
jgi:hypothetical protein